MAGWLLAAGLLSGLAAEILGETAEFLGGAAGALGGGPHVGRKLLSGGLRVVGSLLAKLAWLAAHR
ncbi:MAG: hypothetical protein AMS14_06020 [Planctomycetes bacterium DG_20]|nr:MAG: hypothetical protein AMS14_06020 [Planctomycetes bacterium DG_20]